MKDQNKILTTFDPASRIQSATARASGGEVTSGSFAARAQSAAARNDDADSDDFSAGDGDPGSIDSCDD